MLAEHFGQEHDLTKPKECNHRQACQSMSPQLLMAAPAGCQPSAAVRVVARGFEPGLRDRRMISPASIATPREATTRPVRAATSSLPICGTGLQRWVQPGHDDHRAVTMVFSRTPRASRSIEKVHTHGDPGGTLLLEVQSTTLVRRGGQAARSAPSELFSDKLTAWYFEEPGYRGHGVDCWSSSSTLGPALFGERLCPEQ